jgi:hypothetical protein
MTNTHEVSPASGPTVREYVDYLRAHGVLCSLTAAGTDLWLPGATAEQMRLPLSCTAPVSPEELSSVMKGRGVWVVSYLAEPDETHPANCFFYVCRDGAYSINKLKKRVRASIRKGLETLQVRLCTWDELARAGHAAYADTDVRHGYPAPSLADFQRFVEHRRGNPFLDIWGAWAGDQLAGWLTVLKVDDWALFDAAKSATAFLGVSPNNALYYTITKTMMVDEKRHYVSSGLSTVQAGVNPLSLHRFKISMGHEAVPLRRVFVPHPLLGAFLNRGLVSRVLDGLGKALPSVSIVGKFAGLSRSVSGREKDVLAWAVPEKEEVA